MLKPHEIETYRQLETMLKTHRQCCLIAGTGVGKSRISSHFVEAYELNALIISHRTSINDEWKSWGSPYISTITTQYFYMHYEEFTTGFDIYIFDECQYLGAPKWGEAYDKFKLLIPEDAYILGLTATPKRYERNLAVNIAEKAFGGHIVYGIEKEEAIRLGVIHRSSYVYAIYNAGELVVKYSEKDMTDELRGSLDTFRNMPQIKDILIKHAPKDAPKKGIVYMHDIDSIEEGEVIIRETFPDEQIWSIHSNMPKNDTNKYREEFKKSESGFLVNVDMASEGLHYPGVNMIIMLSKTGSPNKFKQRVGRGSNTPGCVVFDLVGSFVSVRKTLNRIGEDIVGFTKSSSDFGFEEFVSDQEIVYDYVTDLLTVLQEIDEYNSSTWTQEEDEYLRQNYLAKPWKEIAEYLGRTKAACIHRARKLGILKERTDIWTQEEDEFIRQNYGIKSIKEIAEYLGRTEVACRARVSKALGRKKKSTLPWIEEEDEYLRQNYGTKSLKEIAEYLGRSEYECKCRVSEFGLKKLIQWTQEENEFLRQNYGTKSLKEIAEYLGRTEAACATMAKKLGITGRTDLWTQEEYEYLMQNYGTKSLKEIAEHLGRPKGSCNSKASDLGITKKQIPWTQEEDEYIMQNCTTKSYKEIGEYLGRSESACHNRAKNVLGIDKECAAPWTQEDNEYLIQNYLTKTCKEIAEYLGRTEAACAARADKLGIVKKSAQWTQEEDDFLRQNYATKSVKEIAEYLGRTEVACRQRAYAVLNLNKERAGIWTQEEYEYLMQNYGTKSLKEIAKDLGRPKGSCLTIASALCITKTSTPWTQEEDDFLRQNYGTKSLKEIAKDLGRSKVMCRLRANVVLGLDKSK